MTGSENHLYPYTNPSSGPLTNRTTPSVTSTTGTGLVQFFWTMSQQCVQQSHTAPGGPIIAVGIQSA